jgi:hypothetical protein
MDIRLQRNPLLQYAAEHWGNHARVSPEQVILDQILGFLSQDSKVFCFVQAMEISQYCRNGYSQETSKISLNCVLPHVLA